MRPDGTRVKGLSAVVQALPYVMPKRYDAQNMTTETADEDIIRKYIREKRREVSPTAAASRFIEMVQEGTKKG